MSKNSALNCNPLVHEVLLPVDRKEYPAKIVQLEHCETIGLICNSLFDVTGILVEHFLTPGNNLRQHREAIAGRRLGKDRTVFPLFEMISLLRYGLRRRFRPALLSR